MFINTNSFKRPKKKIKQWNQKSNIQYFTLCFLIGFITGLSTAHTLQFNTINLKSKISNAGKDTAEIVNRSIMVKIPVNLSVSGDTDFAGLHHFHSSVHKRRLLIIITTTRSGDRIQAFLLRRLAQTLRLVVPPVLWIVVHSHDEAKSMTEVLRSSGVMYRHLTLTENLRDYENEADRQRNVALSHIEYHRLDGVVHFAEVSNVYDLRFFEEIRKIDVLGAWPVAMVSANRKRVLVDGPVCHSSKVVGWFLKDVSNNCKSVVVRKNEEMISKLVKSNVSGFAFNSSILWDPNRWSRATNLPDTSQNSLKFVQEILVDETKLRRIPANCSKIMLWNQYIPRNNVPLKFFKRNITYITWYNVKEELMTQSVMYK